MRRGAKLSEDGVYRYVLTRNWCDSEVPASLVWVMLNPSIADAYKDDPTIHNVVKITRRAGYDKAIVVNLFAYRSSDPWLIRAQRDPVGPDNDRWIHWAMSQAPSAVLAWGNNGLRYSTRIVEVLNIIGPRRKFCLGLTGKGMPKHPARINPRTPLQEYP